MRKILLIQPRTAEYEQGELFTAMHPHFILIYRVMQKQKKNLRSYFRVVQYGLAFFNQATKMVDSTVHVSQ
jgi:hypothetical protein